MAPATSADWSAGYLAQARADLLAAEAVEGREASVFAMLLQMTFEKLAKAALLHSGEIGIERARSSHKAASMWVRQLKHQRSRLIGAWRDVLDIVSKLESAHPSLSNGPYLEYPWEAPDGAVCWPAKHLPIALELRNPRSRLGPRTLGLAVRLATEFENIIK